MKKIGILSDTHGYLHPRIMHHFSDCDEIWHAGDIGKEEVTKQISMKKPLVAVHGNIDDYLMKQKYPKFQRFKCEEVDVLLTHIGGYPGKYAPQIGNIIKTTPPDLMVCGHSHILKVMPDKTNNLLHINPGAAGKSGFHKVMTIITLCIDGSRMFDLKVIELGKK